MEELAGQGRVLAQLAGESGEQLELRVRQCGAEAELGDRAGHTGEEQRLRLLPGQTGEARAVATGQPVASSRAACRLDRYAGGGQCLKVAMDGAHREAEVRR